MARGLSDWDRRRLEEGHARAARKLAEERKRLAENARRDAERAAQAERDRSEHAARFGPKEVVGPDGVTVRLTARRSGPQPEGPNLVGGGDGDLIALLIAVPLYFLGMLAMLAVNWIVFRGGWTLQIEVEDRPKIKLRLKSEDDATRRLPEVEEAIRAEGLAALERVR